MTTKPKRAPTSTTRRGNGAGWGGPAKGAGKGKPKTDFDETTNAQGHSVATPAPLNRAERRRQRADEMEDRLYHLALNAEKQEVQVQAATRLHAICDGTPVARQEVRLSIDPEKMSDAQLAEIAAQAGRFASE